MNCSDCKKAGKCLRRGKEIHANFMNLCATDKRYVKIWDKRYGVVDESVVPTSLTAPQKPRKVKQKKTQRIRNRNRIKPQPQPQPPRKLLGDKISDALTVVGITEEKVSGWLGKPCGCKERREKLNQLDLWARRILGGNVEDAKEQLEKMVEPQNDN